MKISVLLGLALAATAVAQTCITPTARFKPQMATGYVSNLLMDNLTDPRHMVFDHLDNMLVVERGGGVKQVKFMELSCGYVCVTSSKTILADASLNHGIALSADGTILFVSSIDKVYAYSYDAAAGTVTNGTVVIANMYNTGHDTRTLYISKSKPHLLLVSRGSQGNIDALAGDKSTGHSTIKYFNISDVAHMPFDHVLDGTLLGWGLRNSVGIAEHPTTGDIWSVENSMDGVQRQGVDVHNDNPAEELNYHGVLDDITNTNPLEGANYGYPNCLAVWNSSTLRNENLTVGSQFYANVPEGQDIVAADATCASMSATGPNFTPPQVVFPAHTAPLDIKFTVNGSSAFISFHGSWNRSPPDGYRVVRVDFGGNAMPETSPLAGTTIMSNRDNSKCPGDCFRPTGLAFDSKGRLYMTSDTTRELHLITSFPGVVHTWPGCTPRNED